ncbi:MAG: hypothetical protein ABIR71_00780 [Chthoniobacterales bacterium]
MPPPLEPDPIVTAFRQHVDRSLLRENLKLTPAQRLAKLQSALAFMAELRQAGKNARSALPPRI